MDAIDLRNYDTKYFDKILNAPMIHIHILYMYHLNSERKCYNDMIIACVTWRVFTSSGYKKFKTINEKQSFSLGMLGEKKIFHHL